ncbi:MAG: hypothetical protein GQ583_05840 [Methyloprofundus sp.]|nr:hypothetical protein [Methyloprofundus sp.]
MIEVVIVIVVALAVWLFIHFRKKRHNSPTEETKTVAQKISTKSTPEPEREAKVKLKVDSAPSSHDSVIVETAEIGGNIDEVPEDSTLRRHYLQNIAALEDAGNVVEVEAEAEIEAESVSHEPLPVEAIETQEPVDVIPEDSALRRHYLQNIAALEDAKNVVEVEPEPVSHESLPVEAEAVETQEPVDVIPEDSALRRHYLQNIAALDEAENAVEVEAEPASDEPLPVETETVEVQEPVVEELAVSVAEVSESLDVVKKTSKQGIPEDSALKRHFIQQLVASTEATMPVRPTDSTLKRHYDAQLMSSVASQLEALK